MTEKKMQDDKEKCYISHALKKFKETTKSPEIYLRQINFFYLYFITSIVMGILLQ